MRAVTTRRPLSRFLTRFHRARPATSTTARVGGGSRGRAASRPIGYPIRNHSDVASCMPPHLAAMCILKGIGLVRTLRSLRSQYLLPTGSTAGQNSAVRPRATGTDQRVTEKSDLRDETVADKHCCDRGLWRRILAHPFDTSITARAHRWDKSSCRSFPPRTGATGSASTGTRGFMRAASQHKCWNARLEHWTHFYTDYWVSLEFLVTSSRRATRCDRQPRCNCRSGNGALRRLHEHIGLSPHAMAKLDLDRGYLNRDPSKALTVAFDASATGSLFLSRPSRPNGNTGPLAPVMSHRRRRMPTFSPVSSIHS